jgi:molybdate transport system substrate-binding protein
MTDALIDPKVRVVDTFPSDTQPRIVYPIALTSTAGPGAKNFAAYLRSKAARATFKKYGFELLP